MRASRIAIYCCLLLAMAGCARSSNRSPEELLSLAVSGLSGVDRYAFQGNAGIGPNSRAAGNPVGFRGTVENHDQVSMRSIDPNTSATAIHPLELLNEIEATAAKTELVPEESDKQRAVLRITADPKKAAAVWAERLRSELAMLEKKVPEGTVARGKGERALNAAARSALQEEWSKELAGSKKQLEVMLSTMQVRSVCKLVIDRKRMLPRSLEQRTDFRYQAGGENRSENRSMNLSFERS
ncbi:hypothetical protein [Paenibacillus glycinis]|uniref:Uncharacterized protein n=1 Tax=Paenibacillus glycinis TaxID=2697035 RepID=A0ABW9XUP3_9BACL|nr:hypothetical protein [Paenibacillus glycinis]NBD26407.1 hypothetical protein [Paenibacillus glycinis]